MEEHMMSDLPDKITNEDQLEELLSRPSAEAVEMFSKLDGDILFLGIAGKIGPSLAQTARRACEEAGVKKQIFGVSQFRDQSAREHIEKQGIKILQGSLLDPAFVQSLPEVKNVFFLAGMKFGSVENLALTWAVNSYMPAMVVEHFRNSRIVAFSTGCVYPLVTLESGGSKESDMPEPVGEYAQSCLGRERMFEYGSNLHRTEVALIRLNYSVELRYGVLVDIAVKVKKGEPVDLSMGYFNVIWQGDMNNMVIRSLELCSSPARVLNITGRDIISVREVAKAFGRHFGVEPVFVNTEARTALLSNPSESVKLFGEPQVPIDRVIQWTAEWMKENGKLLGKPTHYEVRDGKY